MPTTETISLSEGFIDFAPSSTVEEIKQNIRTILTTIKGTVPMARDLGLSSDYIDGDTPYVRAQLAADIVAAIEKGEPRARVEEVNFTKKSNEANEMNGKLVPVVIFSIKEG